MSNPEDFVIKNGVLKKYNGSDKDIVIPEEVTELEWDAFKGCSSLTSIQIPEGVTKIGSDTFSGCTNLTSIRIPESVTEMNESAFAGCSSLKSIHVQEANRIFKEIDGIVYNHNITTLLICPNARDKDIVIPDTVTRIGCWSFRDCTNLTRITLPESITTIENSAFFHCRSLTTINIPEGVTEIGSSAFTGCSALQEIILPYGLTQVSNSVFSGCSQIKSIFIPESVKEIEAFAFWNCTSLEKVFFSAKVTIIGAFAFDGCVMLQEVILPDSVTTLGNYAFTGCLGLKRVFIPDSVCKIERETFNECRFLKYLRLPRNAAIDRGTFSALNHLQVDCNFNIPEKLSLAYSECLPFTKLNAETISYLLFYQTAAGWWAQILQAIEEQNIDRSDILNELTKRIQAGKKPSAALGKRILEYLTAYQVLISKDALQNVIHALKAKKCKLAEQLEAEFTNEASTKSATELTGISGIIEKNTSEHFQISRQAAQLKSYISSGVSYADKNGVCSVDAILLILEECLHIPDNRQLDAMDYRHDVLDIHFSEYADQVAENLDSVELLVLLKQLVEDNQCVPAVLAMGRYGGEAQAEYLSRKIEEWKSHKSSKVCKRNQIIGRTALLESKTVSAMMYFEKNKQLQQYAKHHHSDPHDLWFKKAFIMGLDDNGKRQYDLGENKKLLVTIQPDLTVALYDITAQKSIKRVPQKGTDPDKYQQVTDSIAAMKKSLKYAVKHGRNMLLDDFLSGAELTPEQWRQRYSGYIAHILAAPLVWEQDGTTFLISENGLQNQNAEPIVLQEDMPIKLAHPMEMPQKDIAAWQKYFVNHSIRQPVLQIWEPVIDFSKVKEDRYKNCFIPYDWLRSQEKRGIDLDLSYDPYRIYNDIHITFENCESQIKQEGENLEIIKLVPEKHSRRTNHIIAFLDFLTIRQRIERDDVTCADLLPGFTLAQITDFIKLATEKGCPNVTALLLNYKNEHFAGFDPMEEFTLGEL